MQVDTLGIPATAPCSTPMWQSVQRTPFDRWILCEKSNGCCASSRIPKKSRTAAPAVACAGVNTGDVPNRDLSETGRPPAGTAALFETLQAHVPASATNITPSHHCLGPSVRLRDTTETANVVNEIPRVGVGDFALEAF